MNSSQTGRRDECVPNLFKASLKEQQSHFSRWNFVVLMSTDWCCFLILTRNMVSSSTTAIPTFTLCNMIVHKLIMTYSSRQACCKHSNGHIFHMAFGFLVVLVGLLFFLKKLSIAKITQLKYRMISASRTEMYVDGSGSDVI